MTYKQLVLHCNTCELSFWTTPSNAMPDVGLRKHGFRLHFFSNWKGFWFTNRLPCFDMTWKTCLADRSRRVGNGPVCALVFQTHVFRLLLAFIIEPTILETLILIPLIFIFHRMVCSYTCYAHTACLLHTHGLNLI